MLHDIAGTGARRARQRRTRVAAAIVGERSPYRRTRDDADGDHREHRPGSEADRVAEEDHDERCNGPSVATMGATMRPCRSEGGSYKADQAGDVARPGHEHQHDHVLARPFRRRLQEGERQTRPGSNDHHPGQHDARTEHPARTGGGERGGAPSAAAARPPRIRGTPGSVAGPASTAGRSPRPSCATMPLRAAPSRRRHCRR